MKSGFKVLDSDLHTMEPDGLWEQYLEEPFKRFAPRFLRGTDAAPNQPVIKIGDLEIGEMSRRPRTAVVGRRRWPAPTIAGPTTIASTIRGDCSSPPSSRSTTCRPP